MSTTMRSAKAPSGKMRADSSRWSSRALPQTAADNVRAPDAGLQHKVMERGLPRGFGKSSAKLTRAGLLLQPSEVLNYCFGPLAHRSGYKGGTGRSLCPSV